MCVAIETAFDPRDVQFCAPDIINGLFVDLAATDDEYVCDTAFILDKLKGVVKRVCY